MISETFQMIVGTGNNGNLTPSSGCQVSEAGRPVRRLRRKRRLPLDSEDEEENAYEDEVNRAACTFFKESCEKQGQLSQSSLCSANCAGGGCSVPREGLGLILIYISDGNISSEESQGWMNSSGEVKVRSSQ